MRNRPILILTMVLAFLFLFIFVVKEQREEEEYVERLKIAKYQVEESTNAISNSLNDFISIDSDT